MSELNWINNKLNHFKNIDENSCEILFNQRTSLNNPTMNNKIYNHTQNPIKNYQPHHNSSNSSLRKTSKDLNRSPRGNQIQKNNNHKSLKCIRRNKYGYESVFQNQMLLPSPTYLGKQFMSSSQGDYLQNSSINVLKKKLIQNNLLQNIQSNKFLKKGNGNLQNIEKYPQNKKIHNKHEKDKQQKKNNEHFTYKSKSIGKLILGKQTKPTIVLTRQQRLNPFFKQKNAISQEMINKKGILELLSMGVLSKESDFGQILNNKFQVIPELIEQKKGVQKNQNSEQIQKMLDAFFPTNPLTNSGIRNIEIKQDVRDNNYISTQQILQTNSQQQIKKSDSRKSRPKKVKKQQVKQVKPKFQFPQPKFTLTILNYNIDPNQSYKDYVRKIKLQGNQIQFKKFLQKTIQFCQKYKCKKIHFDPQKVDYISGLRKLSDRIILQSIQNYKALGLAVLVRGTKQQIKQSYAKTFFARYRYKKSLCHLQKIQQLKRYFKIRKYYTQMTLKRDNFLKMKLSSFAQNQRRFIENFRQSIANQIQSEKRKKIVNTKKHLGEQNHKYCPQVQIHILSSNFNAQQSTTHYKFRQRLRAQLTRLYNSQPEDIILLVDDQNQMEWQIQAADNQKQRSYTSQTIKNIKEQKEIHKTIGEILLEEEQQFIPQKLPYYQGLLRQLGQTPATIHIIKLGLGQTKIRLAKNNKPQKQSKTKILNKLGKKAESQDRQFYEVTNSYQIEQTASIYYGLNRQIINQIKSICRKRSVAIVPYMSSISIAKISQYLGVNAFAGNLTPQSILKLDQEAKKNQNQEGKIIKTLNKNLNLQRKKIIQSIQMANRFYQSKINIKRMFKKLNIATPDFIQINQKLSNGQPRYNDQISFIQDFTKEIFKKKQINRWVFKLPDSRMSRGIAFLDTQSLKIIKQRKKRTNISTSQIDQIKVILKSILTEKIQIPHTTLLDRKQFFEKFFANIKKPNVNSKQKVTSSQKMGGYIEQMIDASNPSNGVITNNKISSCAVFGKIEIDGRFFFMGSYRKIATEQGINCSAIYPAEQLTKIRAFPGEVPLKKILLDINKATKYLYEEQNVFGYITFELLFNCRNNQYYFIDMVPNLNQYSSFYFFYQNSLQMENKSVHFQTQDLIKKEKGQRAESQLAIDQVLIKANQLPRTILYCPFIDNNGNKMDSYFKFQQELLNKKGILTRFDFDGTRNKQTTNYQSRIQLQSQKIVGTRSNLKSSQAKSRKPNSKILANNQQGYHFFYLTANKPDVIGVACFANQQKSGIKMFLQVLTFFIESGDKFNKFDKRYGQNTRKKIIAQQKYNEIANHPVRRSSNASLTNMKLDGTYIMDIIWKFRELKKLQKSQQQKKTIILMSEAKKEETSFKQSENVK